MYTPVAEQSAVPSALFARYICLSGFGLNRRCRHDQTRGGDTANLSHQINGISYGIFNLTITTATSKWLAPLINKDLNSLISYKNLHFFYEF